MRAPKARGTALDERRLRDWVNDFGTYWTSPTRRTFESWIDQFDESDRDLAARVLDAVLFINHSRVTKAFQDLAAALPGWDVDEAKRVGQFRFVAFSGSSGESGDTMLHNFRIALGLGNRKYHPLFCHRSEIVGQQLTDADTLVLVDDFSGTGKQACDAWGDFFSEMVAGGPRVVLLLIAATTAARDRISSETDMEVRLSQALGPRDNIFDEACAHFTADEKSRLLAACRRVDRQKPKGFGDCGLLLVFSHRCPNNSIPVLHARTAEWEPAFQRHDG